MCLTRVQPTMEIDALRDTVREFFFEMRLAIATLTLWPIIDERANGSIEQRARALVFAPVLGLIEGVVLGLIDRLLAPFLGWEARSFIVVAIAAIAMLFLPWRGIADTVAAIRAGSRPASTGLARIGPIGGAAAMLALGVEVLLLSTISDIAMRTAALVMASLLGRWSIVPVAYGLKPGERWGLGLPFEGGIEFREFAISSVIAIGLTLTLYAGLGLMVTVVLALLILGLRFLFSHRFGRVPAFALAGASAVVEIAVIATLAAL
jgi:cobalamin synthase